MPRKQRKRNRDRVWCFAVVAQDQPAGVPLTDPPIPTELRVRKMLRCFDAFGLRAIGIKVLPRSRLMDERDRPRQHDLMQARRPPVVRLAPSRYP